MSPWPEIISTGGAEPRATIRSSVSRPSMPGILMSSSTASGGAGVELGQRGAAVAHGRDLVALVLEDHPQRVADRGLVVDDREPSVPSLSVTVRPIGSYSPGRTKSTAPAGVAGADSGTLDREPQSIWTRAKREMFARGL